jgi:hypothetical protein
MATFLQGYAVTGVLYGKMQISVQMTGTTAIYEIKNSAPSRMTEIRQNSA